MFSTLGNIFSIKPRQAESTDTRLGIRRHEPEQEQGRKKQKADEGTEFFNTEDEATVSIEALKIFLENFLKSQQEPEKTARPVSQAATAETPVQTSHASGEASQAANAYQATAQTNKKSAPPTASTEESPQGPTLQAHEIRTIHTLLNDLSELSARNIEYLRIERSDSFLNSLVAAVEKTRQS